MSIDDWVQFAVEEGLSKSKSNKQKYKQAYRGIAVLEAHANRILSDEWDLFREETENIVLEHPEMIGLDDTSLVTLLKQTYKLELPFTDSVWLKEYHEKVQQFVSLYMNDYNKRRVAALRKLVDLPEFFEKFNGMNTFNEKKIDDFERAYFAIRKFESGTVKKENEEQVRRFVDCNPELIGMHGNERNFKKRKNAFVNAYFAWKQESKDNFFNRKRLKVAKKYSSNFDFLRRMNDIAAQLEKLGYHKPDFDIPAITRPTETLPFGDQLRLIPCRNYNDMSTRATDYVQRQVEIKPDSFIVVPTGNTPKGMFKYIKERTRQGLMNLQQSLWSHLDDYILRRSHRSTFPNFLRRNLLRYLFSLPNGVKRENVFFFNGRPRSEKKIEVECRRIDDYFSQHIPDLLISSTGYGEKEGRGGHDAFNGEKELGGRSLTLEELLASNTRQVILTQGTRNANAGAFFSKEFVPDKAITLGYKQMMKALQRLKIISSQDKAVIVNRILCGEISPEVVASCIRLHENPTLFIERSALKEVPLYKTPHTVREKIWYDFNDVIKVLYITAERLGERITSLSEKDFGDNGLSNLVAKYGFDALKQTVEQAIVQKEQTDFSSKGNTVGNSPHSDDVEFSCAVQIMRRPRSKVHLFSATDGITSVGDRITREYIKNDRATGEYIKKNFPEETTQSLLSQLGQNEKGKRDTPHTVTIKRWIRIRACEKGAVSLGLRKEHFYAMQLPCCATGYDEKKPVSEKDIVMMADYLKSKDPYVTYVSGEPSDSGAHGLVLKITLEAIERIKLDHDLTVFLYNGPYLSIPIYDSDCFVRFRDEEMIKKFSAARHHLSQEIPYGPRQPGYVDLPFSIKAYNNNKAAGENLYDVAGIGIKPQFLETSNVIVIPKHPSNK